MALQPVYIKIRVTSRLLESINDLRLDMTVLVSHGLTISMVWLTNEVNTRFVISRDSSPIRVPVPSVCDPHLSSNKSKLFCDDLAGQFVFNTDKKDLVPIKITHRKNHGINIDVLNEELQSSELLQEHIDGSVDEIIEANNKGGQRIIKHHALSYTIIITLISCHINKIISGQISRRKTERTWYQNDFTMHFEMYKEICRKQN